MKASTIQNFSYTFLAIVIFVLMYFFISASNYRPKGIFLASSQRQYSASRQAKVFNKLPDTYQKIGIVNMLLYSGKEQPNKQGEKNIVDAALKKIAKHGGAGLIIKNLYYLPKNKYGKLSAGYHLVGEAIKPRVTP